MTVLADHIKANCAPSKAKLTKEEIRLQNLERKRKWREEAKANGAPFYDEKKRKQRLIYWKKLQSDLSPIDFMTRLAKLKLRDETKYQEICKGLDI